MKVGDKVKITKYYKKAWRPFPYDVKEYSKVTQDELVCKFDKFKELYISNPVEAFWIMDEPDESQLKDIYRMDGYQEKWFRVCATYKLENDGEYEYKRFKTINCVADGIICGQRMLNFKGTFVYTYNYDGSESLTHFGKLEKFYLVAINLNKMVLVKADEIEVLE